MFRSSFFPVLGLIFCRLVAAEPLPIEKKAIQSSNVIRKDLQKTAEFIDISLAGKKYTRERNRSQISLSQLVSWSEGGKITNSTDLGVNLRLPNLEKRWQARFSTYDEEAEERNLNQRLMHNTAREKDYGAALVFFKKLGRVRTTFQPRVQLKNPLQVTYVLKFESDANYRSFRIEPMFELLADADKGAGEYAALNFYVSPWKRWSLSQQNEEEYHSRDNGFATRHGITLDYQWTEMRGIGWALIASSDNHQFHLSSLNTQVSWNQQIIKKLLAYSLSPFLGFAKDDHFKGKVGISLNMVITI